MTATSIAFFEDHMTKAAYPLHNQGVPIGPGIPDLVSVVIPSYNRARLVGAGKTP